MANEQPEDGLYGTPLVSYLRITLTVGTENHFTGLLRNMDLQNIEMGLRYLKK
jgi:hypothetical protein